MKDHEKPMNDRREFLGSLATGAATLGIAALGVAIPAEVSAEPQQEVDAWFDKIKGKHKVVFDVTQPHEIFPFAWPRVFLMTNGATGSPEKDCSVVVVLRHSAIGYAMEDGVWAKYKLGEAFGVKDGATQAASLRNPFSNPKPGEFKAPGLGAIAIGIKELQASGVMFCVCDAAMTVNSAVIGGNMGVDPAVVKKDMIAALIPGVQVVPSGVWALGRAQERGCGYIFAS